MQKFTSVLLGVAMTAILVPSTASAVTTPANTFCTRLSGREAELERALDRRDATMESRRAKIDQAFDQRVDRLERRARTHAQRDAVATFKNTVNAARTVRRTANDTAFATFGTAIDTAATRARTDCAAGVAPSTVRRNFQSDLAATRTARNQATDAARDVFKAAYEAALIALQNAFK